VRISARGPRFGCEMISKGRYANRVAGAVPLMAWRFHLPSNARTPGRRSRKSTDGMMSVLRVNALVCLMHSLLVHGQLFSIDLCLLNRKGRRINWFRLVVWREVSWHMLRHAPPQIQAQVPSSPLITLHLTDQRLKTNFDAATRIRRQSDMSVPPFPPFARVSSAEEQPTA